LFKSKISSTGLAGENETALDALDRAIALNPNDAAVFGSRALVLAWLNRPDEAIASAEQASASVHSIPPRFLFHGARHCPQGGRSL
jgi:tetratricopeptide (TPR) repeat protein